MMLAPGSTGEMRIFHRDTALGKGNERDNSFTSPHQQQHKIPRSTERLPQTIRHTQELEGEKRHPNLTPQKPCWICPPQEYF